MKEGLDDLGKAILEKAELMQEYKAQGPSPKVALRAIVRGARNADAPDDLRRQVRAVEFLYAAALGVSFAFTSGVLTRREARLRLGRLQRRAEAECTSEKSQRPSCGAQR